MDNKENKNSSMSREIKTENVLSKRQQVIWHSTEPGNNGLHHLITSLILSLWFNGLHDWNRPLPIIPGTGVMPSTAYHTELDKKQQHFLALPWKLCLVGDFSLAEKDIRWRNNGAQQKSLPKGNKFIEKYVILIGLYVQTYSAVILLQL